MDNKQISNKLEKLIKLDIDAVRAYEQALSNIDHAEIHHTISQFRDDHKRHIKELCEAVRNLGEEPPSDSPDLKGFFIEGFTAIRSATGTEGALKAMHTNEKLTTSTYEDALLWEVTPPIHAIIEKNYSDEQRHLQYIQQALDAKIWETASTSNVV